MFVLFIMTKCPVSLDSGFLRDNVRVDHPTPTGLNVGQSLKLLESPVEIDIFLLLFFWGSRYVKSFVNECVIR